MEKERVPAGEDQSEVAARHADAYAGGGCVDLHRIRIVLEEARFTDDVDAVSRSNAVDVAAAAAGERVVAAAAVQGIVPRVSEERVVAAAADQDVVPIVGFDEVIPAEAVDRVGSRHP